MTIINKFNINIGTYFNNNKSIQIQLGPLQLSDKIVLYNYLKFKINVRNTKLSTNYNKQHDLVTTKYNFFDKLIV